MEGGEVRGLLHPFLLLLICERPGHGYELIERLERLGAAEVEAGHVYRVLRSLERERLVVSAWIPSESGPARRRYELTAAGLAELESCMGRLARLADLLDSCLARWGEAVRPRTSVNAVRRRGRDGAGIGGAGTGDVRAAGRARARAGR